MQLLMVKIDATALCDFNDVLSSTSDQELAPVHSFAWHTGREATGQSELGFRPFSMSLIPEPTSTSTSTMPSFPSAPRRTKNITITESYWELPPQTINFAFMSLQDSMDQCIIQRGDNDFKPRHTKKAQLEREGRLPLRIRCSDEAAEYAINPSVL
ncbi:unnamed protein product [Phytophthora fragariaefolia]|uniref:Unnamed protein product n=1 Tax=Phytophthora fragariaefolia TaxID=1490495 RepID=A0A9W6XA62_9STRA|nr:unnamed protein product [Phytophthora fragariaefolia]